jgi:hypothetical protein
MLAAKQAHEPVFPFVARAIRSGATRALAMAAEVDLTLADRVRSEARNTFASAWETLATRCESLLLCHSVCRTIMLRGATPGEKIRASLRLDRLSCKPSPNRAAYGQQASTIVGNCSVHVYARSEDLATAEYISERIGMAEEIVATESRSAGPAGQSVTQGQLRRFRPLLTAPGSPEDARPPCRRLSPSLPASGPRADGLAAASGTGAALGNPPA